MRQDVGRASRHYTGWNGAALDSSLRAALDLLPDAMREAWQCDWSAVTEGLVEATNLFVLGRGLGLDDAPTDEVKADQKRFFRLLYHLLVDAERGPRLPTLFVALGAETVRELLTPVG